MKSIFIATFFLISGIAFADVPNTFEAGSAIKASEMNENFTSIDSKVDALDSRTQNVSELETKVANLEGQVETLQSLVNSVAETASTDVEFMGYTAPMIFGAVGLQEGRSACPNLYPDSKVCSVENVRNFNDWSSFTLDNPLFLVLTEDGQGSDSNLCNDYSGRSGGASMAIIEEGKLFLKREQSYGYTSFTEGNISAWSWVASNLTLDNSGNNYEPELENTYYDYYSGTRRFYSCNVSMPAACCK